MKKGGFVDYFEDSESVLANTTVIRNSKLQIEMVRLDEFLLGKGVTRVDFLKSDVEGYDYFVLVGFGEFIKNCKYIQFELGIGAPFHERFVQNEDYFSLLERNYRLYLLKDEFCPIWSDGEITDLLVNLDDNAKSIIFDLQKQGIGFNIVGVNKSITLPISISVATLPNRG